LVEQEDTILTCKKIIEEKEKILKEDQILVFAGKLLEDHRSLSDYNIYKESVCN